MLACEKHQHSTNKLSDVAEKKKKKDNSLPMITMNDIPYTVHTIMNYVPCTLDT